MSIVSTLYNLEAKAASFLVKVGQEIKADILPALTKLEASAATVEAITNLVSPAAEKVEVAAFSLLGAAVTAIEAGIAAGAKGGVNIALDAAAVADIQALIPAIKGAIASAKK